MNGHLQIRLACPVEYFVSLDLAARWIPKIPMDALQAHCFDRRLPGVQPALSGYGGLSPCPVFGALVGQWPAEDDLPIEELARRQAVKAVASLDELAQPDLWESDEEYEEFLADLYASRRSDVA